ncbi:MAG: MASE1 domain-containing protein, partial [Burkholderiales bacterium]|nr:MASE1 domain-containing protein [Burkholderiales bacterium]
MKRVFAYLLKTAGFAVIYFLAAKLGFLLFAADSAAATVSPASGIALAVLLLGGIRYFPGIAIGAALANFSEGLPLLATLGIALGDTLASMLATWLLHREGFSVSFERLEDALRLLVIGAVASQLLGAAVGTASLALGGVLPAGFMLVWIVWWMGAALGVALITPVLLSWVA